MKIAVLGTGMVGNTIASKLIDLGHEVRMGSRTSDNPKGAAWAAEQGERAGHGSFAEVSAWAETVWNCTMGVHSVAAIEAAGVANLDGKILVDIANPLDFSQGFPPSLSISNTDSLGEAIQRAAPGAKVVKALNTINHLVMVDPSRIPGEHDLLIAGDDAEAKAAVSEWMTGWFGWGQPIDVGGIDASRGIEAWLPLWVRLYGALGTADFNLKIVRA